MPGLAQRIGPVVGEGCDPPVRLHRDNFAGRVAVPGGITVHRYVLPVMAHAAATNVPASCVTVYSLPELVRQALAGLVIAVAGALLPASWAAGTRTATAVRAE